jgi:hypothetical protein
MGTDPKYFNNDTYGGWESPLVDGSDALANKGLVIGFYHVPSETEVYFKAFITAFNETYSSDWNSESVYGRVDPIYQFKNTTRRVTLAFKIPASTTGEAYGNLAKVQTLLQFLYPTYENIDSATTITQSPLVRIQVMNLLAQTSPGSGDSARNGEALYSNYISQADASSGLLGVINNLSVNHNLENPDIGVIEKGDGDAGNIAILPKMIEVNLDFAVVHEQSLGWQNGTFINQLFPYKAPAVARQTRADMDIPTDNFNPGEFTNSEDPGAPSNTGFPENIKENEDGFLYVAPGSEEDGEAASPYTSEQNFANAQARYSGLFGNARFNRDLRQYMRGDNINEYQESALRGATGYGGSQRDAGSASNRSDADYTVSRRTQRVRGDEGY